MPTTCADQGDGTRALPSAARRLLLALLAALQAQLWLGRGSIPRVAAMQNQLNTQKTANARANEANERLASEVHDLKEGLDMVEEKARSSWAWSNKARSTSSTPADALTSATAP